MTRQAVHSPAFVRKAKKAIDIDGETNAVVLEHLGDVLYMQGKKSEAVEYWKKALDLDSSNESLINKVATGAI